MSSLYRVLREKFSLLKLAYETSIDEISGADIVYTDGLAAEAKFKIIFTINKSYITTVYVKDDGAWFSTVDNYVIKKAMKAWIEAVSNPEVPAVEVPPLNQP